MLIAYLVKMAGALLLVFLACLAIRLFYGRADPSPLTDDEVVSEVAVYELDARVTEIVFSSDRSCACAVTDQGHKYIVGRVGSKLYCRSADSNIEVGIR